MCSIKHLVSDLSSFTYVSYENKPSYFPLYWLVYRDPYIGLLKSPYNWVVFHPLYNLNNQGFFHCSCELKCTYLLP